jgi:Nitrile hydratase beta subunit
MRVQSAWSARMSRPEPKNMPRKGAGGRTAHDIGGLDFGPIDRSEHDLALWEKRTDALLILLRDNKRRAFTVDAHRRMIESYGEQEYDRTTYYEKWIRAIRNLVVEQQIVTREEIEVRMAEVRAKHAKAGRKAAKETIPW